eukprot:GFUD01034543.1.p2 GENE.GFUD01034543.1~~GFUD01034543.1.p2  ORF type:complete len:106 (-),score=13.71 GFUD01034543.1:742-1059(-)
MPYLLSASQIASPNHSRSIPIASTQPPKYPGRCWTSHFFYPVKVLGIYPRTHQVEPVPKGAKFQQPGLKKPEPTTALQKTHQSSERMMVLKLHILCIGVITRTGG